MNEKKEFPWQQNLRVYPAKQHLLGRICFFIVVAFCMVGTSTARNHPDFSTSVGVGDKELSHKAKQLSREGTTFDVEPADQDREMAPSRQRRRSLVLKPAKSLLRSASSALLPVSKRVATAKEYAANLMFPSRSNGLTGTAELVPGGLRATEERHVLESQDERDVGERQVESSNGMEHSAALEESATSEYSGDQAPETEGASNDVVTGADRIVGGEEVEKGRYDFMVELTNGLAHQCGGTLIAPDAVLTAAHCVRNINAAKIGIHARSDPQEVEQYVFQTIETHPEFNHYDFKPDRFDVAIVWLHGRSYHSTVLLNFDEEQPSEAGEKLTTMGWGYTEENGEFSDPLLEVKVGYVPLSECKASWHEGNTSEMVFDEMMCAAADGKDSCSGDSGGPLLIRDRRSEDKLIPTVGYEDVQVGIVGAGRGCAHPSFPGVYFRVSSAIGWIRERICARSSLPPADFDCDLPVLPEDRGGIEYVRVVIRFDYLPGSLGWMIQSLQDRKIYAYYPIGFYKDQFKEEETVEQRVKLHGNREYKFVLMDFDGDGISWWSEGYYAVYRDYQDGSPEELLVEEREFTSGTSSEKRFFVNATRFPINPPAQDRSVEQDPGSTSSNEQFPVPEAPTSPTLSPTPQSTLEASSVPIAKGERESSEGATLMPTDFVASRGQGTFRPTPSMPTGNKKSSGASNGLRLLRIGFSLSISICMIFAVWLDFLR